MRDDGQALLFGDDEWREPDDPAERRREMNRLRQLRWRRRHQFCAPIIESPTGGTYFVEALSTS